MKDLFKRNQIVITALAGLIAVAGYLNYVNGDAVKNAIGQPQEESDTVDVINIEDGTINVADISEEDIQAENQTTSKEDTKQEATTAVPGEAVLASSILDFTTQARLNREQLRSENKETLLEIINNSNIADDQKKDAIAKMIELTAIAEKESGTETALAAKGFNNAVVTISGEKVDVMLDMTNVTDAMRAQIEDIVKGKTEFSVDKITITPLKTE